MRLTILTVGSRGDIQPFVALGGGLQQAGHAVRLATHGIFEPLARMAGLDFAAINGNPQAIVQGEAGRQWMESNRNPLKFVRGFRDIMGPVLRQATQEGLAAADGSDAIIFAGPAFYFGYNVAEKLRVPFVQAYLQPIHPTGEFSSALLPTNFNGGRAFNYFTHLAGAQLFWQALRPVVNDARRDLLQLPPLARLGPFLDMERQQRPVLYGYSPAVLPKPKNWGEWIHVVGYWFVNDGEWTPSAALTDFLQAGPPPVSVGFGSMADRDPARMTELVLAALKQSRQRGLLLTGWGGLAQSDLPDDVFKIEAAPHDWLFPRMTAVIHHGGAGTTAAGLRAGVPNIVVPFFGDQLFWAQRVHALGVGPRPVSRKELTAERLSHAIMRTTSDHTMRARAAALGERVRAEDGVRDAVEVIGRGVKRET